MKSLGFIIPPPSRVFSIPGQDPNRRLQELEALTAMPSRRMNLLASTHPCFTPERVVEGLGLSRGQENDWVQHIAKAMTSQNELLMRQDIMSKMFEEGMSSDLRRVLFARSLSLWREKGRMAKSVAVVTVEDLKKAQRSKEGDVRYVRFGDVPKSGRSYNTREGIYEAGVSCYRQIFHKGKWWFDGQGASFGTFGLAKRPLNVIEGTLLTETGSDGEPLLGDARVVGRTRGLGPSLEKVIWSKSTELVQRHELTGKVRVVAHGLRSDQSAKWFASPEAVISEYKGQRGQHGVDLETSVRRVLTAAKLLDGPTKKPTGPYIGPRGGKWADPKHTIPWKIEKSLSGNMLKAKSSTPMQVIASEMRGAADHVQHLIDNLEKADPRGGTYVKRVPKPGGGHRYFYDEDKYNAHDGAHVSGSEAAKAAITKAVAGHVKAAGKNGCELATLKPLAKRYGAELVGGMLNQACGQGSLRYEKGRLFASGHMPKEQNGNKTKDANRPLAKSERFVVPDGERFEGQIPHKAGVGHKFIHRAPKPIDPDDGDVL